MARAEVSSAQAPAGARPAARAGAAEVEREEREDREDEAALRAFLGGDQAPFARLMRRHEKAVYGFCLRMLGQRSWAEDATQEVFLRVVRSVDRWRPSARVRSWIFSIARNHCIDELRKAKHRKTDSLDRTLEGGETVGARVADEGGPGPERGAASAAMRGALLSALAALPDEQREVFVMREQAGMSFREIAAVVAASENTVKSRMRYALSGLRRALAERGITAEDARP